MQFSSNTPSPNRTQLLRDLGFRDAVAIVAGTIVGSGIFLVPNSVASQLSSLSEVLLIWVVGGLLSLSGALALGELGSAIPGAGGLYVYLRHAYGKSIGFLYGWSLLALIHSGSIATLTVAFRIYFSQVVPLTMARQKVVGVAGILLLSSVNCIGVRFGKGVQNIFAVAKFGGLAVMILLLFYCGHTQMLAASLTAKWTSHFQVYHFGIALIGVLWAYEGWHIVSFTAGEFRNPLRDLPRGLLFGTLIVILAYLLSNVGYYSVLTPTQIRGTDRVAATAVGSVFGGGATVFLSWLILISIIGSWNGLILTGPRVYYAMAADGLFFSSFGKVSHRFRTPIFAILVQGIWAAVLSLLGTFQELFTYVIFTAWIFYGLAVAGVIVLRIRRPDLTRPFLTPGYPWLPTLFTIAALAIAASAIISAPLHAMIGIGLILSGLPVFLLFESKSKGKATSASG